jgi:hypothetical protein
MADAPMPAEPEDGPQDSWGTWPYVLLYTTFLSFFNFGFLLLELPIDRVSSVYIVRIPLVLNEFVTEPIWDSLESGLGLPNRVYSALAYFHCSGLSHVKFRLLPKGYSRFKNIRWLSRGSHSLADFSVARFINQ